MDAENTCNGGKANGSHMDNGRANEFQSACSIRRVHDRFQEVVKIHLQQNYVFWIDQSFEPKEQTGFDAFIISNRLPQN